MPLHAGLRPNLGFGIFSGVFSPNLASFSPKPFGHVSISLDPEMKKCQLPSISTKSMFSNWIESARIKCNCLKTNSAAAHFFNF